MNTKFITLLFAAVIIAGIMIFQATRTSAASVLVASDLLAHSSETPLSRIRVGGRVVDLPIDYVTDPKIKLSFRIKDPGFDDDKVNESNTIKVVYDGLKPDMFAAGRDVIVDGRYEGGVFYASSLLTQCPSKYEPPEGPHEDPVHMP